MNTRRILVASDGSPESMGALRLARALQRRSATAVEVEVLAVVEPLPVFDTGFMVALPESDLVASRREGMEKRLRAALEDLDEGGPGWPVNVRSGLAAPTISEEAERAGADLIVAGVGHHRAIDRIFGTETVLQLLHLLHVPLLAVPRDAGDLPERAVFALDFSSFGYRAAGAASLLLGPDTEVHLAHVLTGAEHVPEAGGPWRDRYETEVRERLRAHGEELGVDRDRLRIHLLEGDPSDELLALSRDLGGALLVAGTHGHSFVGRLLLGSVSVRLVRGAAAPLLVVPPAGSADGSGASGAGGPAASGGAASGAARRIAWRDAVAGFSSRNQGRSVHVDVFAPSWGLQHSGRDLPLRGVAFDPEADRVEVMLGDAGGERCHFTHVVPAPVHIEVVTEEGGADRRLLVEGRHSRMSITLAQPAPQG